MREHDFRDSLLPGGAADNDGEGWMMSYLDVLTLLITLFVLLLSMAGAGSAIPAGPRGERISIPAQGAAVAVTAIPVPETGGMLPRHQGLQPDLGGIEIEGVSVVQDKRGITLRIDDNLLFESGQASLTPGGESVLEGLLATLQEVDGRISVEGHTDSLPIATPQFPSNWELSTARAIAVLRYLERAGIRETRLRAIGYADTRPLQANDTPRGRAANRRVELLLEQ